MTAHELANKLLTMANVDVNIKIEAEKITGTGLYDLMMLKPVLAGAKFI